MNTEKAFHWTVWVVSITFSVLKLYQATKDHPNYSPEDFTKGFSFIDRPRDNSDTEWAILGTFLKKKWWVFLIFLAGSRARFVRPSVYLSVVSSVFIVTTLSWYGLIFYLLYIFICYGVQTIGQKSLCYAWAAKSLALIHTWDFYKAYFPEQELFLFEVGLSWLIAKCLSYSLDRIENETHRKCDLLNVISYCLYWPTVFTGPIIVYEDFIKQLDAATVHPITSLVKELCLVCLWCSIYELLLHFIYSSAVQFFPEIVEGFDAWTLCGLGYALPLLFFLKYRVIYGLAHSLSRGVGVTLPPPPRCISAVHSPTFLWRHFDRGLYVYLSKYLYRPLMADCWKIGTGLNYHLRRTLGVLLCFSSITLFHGAVKPICAWSAINFLLVTTEPIVAKYGNTALTKIPHFLLVSVKGILAKCGNIALTKTPHFLLVSIKGIIAKCCNLIHGILGLPLFRFVAIQTIFAKCSSLFQKKLGLFDSRFVANEGRHICTLLGVPHFILMCISCVFFLSNFDTGMVFVNKILLRGGLLPIVPLAVVMYCGCHVGMDCMKVKMATLDSSNLKNS